MQANTLSPDTIFHPLQSPLLASSPHQRRLGEQQQYKLLIDSEARHQNVPLAHLAERVQRRPAGFHKIIRGKSILHDDLRDHVFLELGIDHVRAIYCVALLRDYQAYRRPRVLVVSEAIKGIGYQFESAEQGEIQIEFKPPVVHEASRRLYGQLLGHQERLMAMQFMLQT